MALGAIRRFCPTLKVRAQLFGYPLRLGHRKFWDWSPLGATFVKRASYVDVNVGNRLMRRCPIVLPDGDSGSPVRAVNCPRNLARGDHDLGGLLVAQLKDGLAMSHWHDQEMWLPARLLRDHDRYAF
jgi:hypothetical protein